MRGSEYTELMSLVEVVRQRSFRKAARQLGLTPSALSHTIRALEQRMQVRLLNRTTRSLSPTEAGSLLLERIAPAFDEITAAVASARRLQDHPTGVVRLNVPGVAAHVVLAPLLPLFARAYPDIRLEVTIEDGLVDIVESGFDAGIRPGERLQRDMIALRLTPDLMTAVVCAPAYLQARAAPETPHDLAAHACLMYRWKESGRVYPWPLGRTGEAVDIQFDGTMSSNDLGMIMATCLAGGGIACLARELVAPYLASGQLVSLLEDWCQSSPGFFLYYPSRQTSAAVRAFIDFMKAQTG